MPLKAQGDKKLSTQIKLFSLKAYLKKIRAEKFDESMVSRI